MQAIILGFTQGITEFLPISSSAHLVFVPDLLGIPKPPLVFDVLLHLGTLVAVVFHFRSDLFSLVSGFLKGEKGAVTMIGWLVVGSIPAAFVGVFFHDVFAGSFSSPLFPAIFLLVTGWFLHFADRTKGKKDYSSLGIKGAFLVGIFQAMALLPGISRSGATLSAGCFRGLSRQAAARFSFLLSIPIILGAGAYEALGLAESSINLSFLYLAGAISAGVSGFLVIKYFLRYLSGGRLLPFTVYCWVVGLLFLIRILTLAY